MMIEIRPVCEADLPDLLDMVHGLARHHDDQATATLADLKRDMLAPHPWVHTLIAENLGYIAMCPLVQLQFGVRGMDVHHLYVRETARGSGVGRALMDAARTYVEDLGCRYLTVGTHPENVDAQAMYLAIGFEAMGPLGPRFRMKW